MLLMLSTVLPVIEDVLSELYPVDKGSVHTLPVYDRHAPLGRMELGMKSGNFGAVDDDIVAEIAANRNDQFANRHYRAERRTATDLDITSWMRTAVTGDYEWLRTARIGIVRRIRLRLGNTRLNLEAPAAYRIVRFESNTRDPNGGQVRRQGNLV